MILNYKIKHNGIDYPIGSDVPLEDKLQGATSTKAEVKEPEKVVETVIAEEKKYTKTEINRLSTKELRELAKTVGINGDEYVGSELKSMLIEKLV